MLKDALGRDETTLDDETVATTRSVINDDP
jgi:hypothetical protein